jgi:membrane protease YdiL (CAAX protease family)
MIKQENKAVRVIIIAMAFLLSFLFVVNPLSQSIISVYIIFLIIAFWIYSMKEYQLELIGISTKTLGRSLIWGLSIGGLFYLATKLVQGLSFGLPLLPNAISDQLKLFIIVLVAPIVEEIFFRGSLLAYLRDTLPTKKNIWMAIIVQAVIFSIFHLGAYITGFYSLPSINVGLMAINSNISAFISAGLFGMIAGIIAVKTKNLLSTIILHSLINLIIYTTLSVIV